MNTFYKAITIAIIMTVAMAGRAQNAVVHFGYDGDGNRISRTLTIDRNEEKSQAADSTTNLASILETLDNDVSGSVVLSREMSDGKHDFDLSEMSPGIYMLLFSSPNITKSWKIIKD